MNFFDQQASKRRQSFVLLILFLLTMAAMGGVIQSIVVGLSKLLGEQSSFLEPSAPALTLIGLVWFTVLAGGYFRYLDVRSGGAMLARRFGAVRASDRARFDKEQRLLNIVAEMAIASSTTQPDVYILRNESSINAFVLGAEDERHAMVVTQGALDAFDRTQLQAVVAHEFGHIKNGDLPTNMRLLIALGGLMAIDEVGRLLIGDSTVSRDDPISFHPGVIVGYVLRAIGSVGVFSGQLIRSAFSRQREYLADASAVQFTRDPVSLASALDIIRQREDEPALHSLHAQELAHLCFQANTALVWYRRLTASHPDIQLRIQTIEPHFSVKRRKSSRASGESASNRGSADSSPVSMPGSMGAHHLYGTNMVVEEVTRKPPSDRLLLLLPDESSCLAVLFALFVSDDPDKREQYHGALSRSFNEGFLERVQSVCALIPGELRSDRLGVIEHACSVLSGSIKQESRQRLLLKLERLLRSNDEYDLMRYASLQLIRRRLGVEFPMIESIVNGDSGTAQARHVKAFESMGREFALLLSLMVESSGASAQVLDAEFERVLKCYTTTRYPRRTAREEGIIQELEAAFQTLYVQPKSIRMAFVQHCLEIVEHDGYVARAERTLLDLFAASLGCDELAA
ncbi:M48 family metalloprotease [Granulosicoccus antarcticus]|uniref:Peptidase M48 domain-containing protein n=1 Tax=Granulosicoccus antarcticus IMCC3135 TaxID=1192854 RepID=A0A2Z2NRQ5_9GAMM|nr:M48 family metalloprotease [Granulosicoccus antarcticus]ASJ72418.1 hypothetical protein IMCC3135_11640 [Granulosicoccus antarcticus IMCC3135]